MITTPAGSQASGSRGLWYHTPASAAPLRVTADQARGTHDEAPRGAAKRPGPDGGQPWA